MKNSIGSYSIERFVNGDLRIDYKRSQKDIFYILVYFLISVPILFFDFKLVSYLMNEKINSNVIIGYFFSSCLLFAGLYFLIVSIETFIKPTKSVFLIDASKKQLTIKLNLFRKFQFNFIEIKQLNLGSKDITVTNYHKGRTFKRQLFLIHMHIELLNNKTIKIHQFENLQLLISSFEKKRNQSFERSQQKDNRNYFKRMWQRISLEKNSERIKNHCLQPFQEMAKNVQNSYFSFA